MSKDEHEHHPVHAQDKTGGLYTPAPPKETGGEMQSSKWPTIGRIVWTIIGALVIVLMFWVSFSTLNDPKVDGGYSHTTNVHAYWAWPMCGLIGFIALIAFVLSIRKKGSRIMALLCVIVMGVAAWMVILLTPLTETTGHFGG